MPEETLVPQGSRQFVFKVVPGADGAQTVKFTEVTLGRRRQGEVQIVSGLARGDVVVTAGVSKIRDNAAVTVQVPPPETPPAAPSTASGSLPAGQACPGRPPDHFSRLGAGDDALRDLDPPARSSPPCSAWSSSWSA